ncbi:hypothetical protein LNP17_00445 [Klebsiella variicola subsp. variicola]|nr:hypothetical protein [Klebsiella variicola subsp. variicola]
MRQAFAILETTLHQTGEETLEGTIKIRVMPSFATKWLLPRLHQFYEQYPISSEIDADMTPANFKSDAVDIAITPFWVDDKKSNSTASVQRCDLSRDQPGFVENTASAQLQRTLWFALTA